MKKERGKVWLGAGVIVTNDQGEWLVVKKTYGGLKDVWSIPAGFVDVGETLDAAAKREVLEETGIDCVIQGVYGVRSGVIRDEVSDNMVIFYAHASDATITIDERELSDARWIHPTELATDPASSFMLRIFATEGNLQQPLQVQKDVEPDSIFGYTDYKVFL
ncbi:NUDIX domain-containing protein [Caryophanon latum]|uniref:NUDIX hydrolase n=1 Tax=Caryophanon latum TaxID=33977 RepID=A0A1C0YZF4_9BACL|nr:NUDIX hydrolase [Caryophanon latum]OCS92574.1 NUDIX hydrolase [Caryophanon latum]